MSAPVTTAVTICNSALLKLGAGKISALTQTTRAAVVCNTLYAYLRDELLGIHPWRFATKTVALAPNSTAPVDVDRWDYSYDIPTDCIRPLGPTDDTIKWAVEGDQILTTEASFYLKYIYRNTDEGSWDARFCEALSWRLAMELALSLVQNITMKQECEKSYKDALSAARGMNGLIGTLPPLEADIWTQARRGGRFNPLTGFQS